jgi:glycosyltransferase involved in cell wall biosynthesis
MDAEFGQQVTWDEPLLDGYVHEFLPDAETCSPGGFRALRGAGVEATIRRLNPDVVLINGINYEFFVRALVECRRRKVPVWLRSETQDHAFARGHVKSLVRAAIYRAAYAQIAHFFPIGKLNAAHYRAHGVRDRQMTFCHYCVVDRFSGPAEEMERRRKECRTRLGFGADCRVVMFSGKLIPKKTPLVLLEALEGMPAAERTKFALLYVGSGEQEALLRERADHLGTKVVFTGFVNQGEIADYYLASDALILPSQQMGETWGLVANEALMAGKPVILSRHAGSSVDFGKFLGVQVVEPLAESVTRALRNLEQMPHGAAVRAQMEDYTIEAAARAIAGEMKQRSAIHSIP